MAYYQRIKDLREDADKTQTDIAKFLGTTAQSYGKYEKGDREIPFSRAVELAQYYHVSLDYIAGRTPFKKTLTEENLKEDEITLIQKYRNLSEKNKGKLELFLDQLLSK